MARYTALYRKLRPTAFSDVVGQEHIVRTLINQIKDGRVTHAYLFCGTRGTGKTTTAKIFSRAVNCSDLHEGEPCGGCQSCQEILRGTSINVIEIDAASNNGVDNIREIRDDVAYPPTVGNYKVYIIDEVHMLSTGAFNALLKTLEEPPPHVIFILATTDPQKIPATIHSRCQRFDFKRITMGDMAQALTGYASEEGISITGDAIRYIARTSDGAMRDAISILDQCTSFYSHEEITLEKVLEITGAVSSDVFFRLCVALIEYDATACLEIINDVVMQGRDLSQFASGFLGHLRDLLIAKSNQGAALNHSEENLAELSNQAERVSTETLLGYISAFSELQNRMRYAADGRILLEVCCIGICRPASTAAKTAKGNDALQRIEKIEEELVTLKSNGITITAAAPANSTEMPAQASDKVVSSREKAVSDDIRTVIRSWNSFLGNLPPAMRAFLDDSTVGSLGDDTLSIICSNNFNLDQIKKAEAELGEQLFNVYKKEIPFALTLGGDYDNLHRERYGGRDNFDYGDEQSLQALIDDLDCEPTVTDD